MKGVGKMSAADALSWGWTGPCLRSTGVAYDVRRAEPYSVYPELEFEIPTGAAGDAFDRYMVRFQEMEQSLRIIEQAINSLPEGDPCVKVGRIHKPAAAEAYCRTENPKGELQEFLQARSSEAPRYHIASSSGPDHDRLFECTVHHAGVELARGVGKSKKAAESEAAQAALKKLREASAIPAQD